LSHLRILAQRLEDLPHAVLCGAIPKMERFAAKTSMDAGELPLLLATRVFSKGVDIRTVDVIVDATAGKSHNSAVQRYGRGVRTAEGKSGLLYFDITDSNSSGLGKVKNRFASSARSRLKALQALGVPVISKIWGLDSPKQMYQALERRLYSSGKQVSK
jgi:superfamily II DNA or RNA helicase